MCNVIKREHVSFKFESTQRISQLKYGSYSYSKKGISDTLRANSDFLRMKKYDYQTKESFRFFLVLILYLKLSKTIIIKIKRITLMNTTKPKMIP